MKKHEKGSAAVETAVIFPVVLIAICMLITGFIIYYQKIIINNITKNAAATGADIWTNTCADINTGKLDAKDLVNTELYWKLFGDNKQEKIKIIKENTIERINNKSIIKYKSIDVDVGVKDSVLYKKIFVTIKCQYFFGIYLSSYNEYMISRPASFIRNTDFLLELEKKLIKNIEGLNILKVKADYTMEKIKANILK